MLQIIKSILFLCLVLTFTACGGGGGGDGDTGAGGDAPTATVSPITSSLINASTGIVVSFDQSMDRTSLSLSGSMVSDGGVWTTTSIVNDTLTISPQTRWAEGAQTLTFNALNSEGMSLGTLTLDYVVDDTAPSMTSNPSSGAVIQNSMPVVLTFSESMDIATASISGNLWDESDQGVWSSNANTNDTLTISPLDVWTVGSKVLTVDAQDTAGNVLMTQGLTYTVDAALPVASVSPASGSSLSQTTPIIIQFTRTMDISTVVASGSLWDESNSGVWSTTTNANDTFTLSPLVMWSLSAKSLTLDVMDTFGNGIETLNVSYSVGCEIGLTNCAGTCIDLGTDTNNCGACGTVCGNVANSSGSVCSAGTCAITTCNNGFDDCNNTFSDGCEVNTTADSGNCGSCGSSCNDGVSCSADACVSSACTNTENDSVCPQGNVCQTGVCSGTGCLISDLAAGTSCGTGSCGSYGACGGFTNVCDETGTQSRTCTTPECNGSGSCTSVTSTSSRSCTRNTDGNACPTGACSNGTCVAECVIDSDCPTNQICIVGVCEVGL